MLYPQNINKKLTHDLFKNPTSEYRGTPFWAWNCKLTEDLIVKEIGYFKQMGLGGFHVHCRTGLDTEYLSNEFMSLVKVCRDEAEKQNMLLWLYDEDRWPSGFGGGYVTQDHQYRARFLNFIPYSKTNELSDNTGYDSSARAQGSGDRTLLAVYEVILNDDGTIKSYNRHDSLHLPEYKENLWFAYLEVFGDNPWFNNQAYVNTLDKKSIERFIEITHEKYNDHFGKDFGGLIPAIFTDEPQFSRKDNLSFAHEKKNVVLPFTDDFDDTYQQTYQSSILDSLPELIWDLSEGKISLARYQYHDHISERFAEAFPDTIGKWCAEHGIMLTGHMMEEPTLHSQTCALGEAMRMYRGFQLPGIDILCDSREFTTAKQAQSACHQLGAPGVLSELYGVTNWDFDFRGHKLQGDWQAALGVTVRVHHLAWLSMAGEAKRDYPACIGYQSPWYKEYAVIENHFSRLNTALTRGTPHVRLAVIHPVESYWLHWSAEETSGAIRETMDHNFQTLTDWLLRGLIDFDFISEGLNQSLQVRVEDQQLYIGAMKYDAILVPPVETLRSSTLDLLEQFTASGGKVIFAGDAPYLVDAVPSDRGKTLATKCSQITFSKYEILEILKPFKDITVKNTRGSHVDNLLYQMRQDGDNRWLFICHADNPGNPDIPREENITIQIKGKWDLCLYNTITGEKHPLSASVKDGNTIFTHQFYAHDSILLFLEPTKESTSPQQPSIPKKQINGNLIDASYTVELSEPNVLLLDLAEYKFDEGKWQPKDELLRIDNKFRDQLGYPPRQSALAQPWVYKDEESITHTLHLRFNIHSEVDVNEVCLALENPASTKVVFNGKEIESNANGYFVDESIQKVTLGNLQKGKNTLLLSIDFAHKTNVEWCYLLGDFGVQLCGNRATITEPVRSLQYGDWCSQGLPFYAGNVTYKCKMNSTSENAMLQVTHYRSPLLSVSVDGRECGKIIFSPYKLELEDVAGEHNLEITVFGNRYNAFGPIHNADRTLRWAGPDAWRSRGAGWSYEYQLRPMGVLTAPTLYTEINI